jgi:hypothetical protein
MRGDLVDRPGCWLRRRAVSGEEQVVGERYPVPALHGKHLVSGVGVERHEHQRRGRPAVADGFAAVFDDEVAAGGSRRQQHHQRGDHRVVLLGVLVRGEELAGFVDEHRVQLGAQPTPIRKAEVGAYCVEHG